MKKIKVINGIEWIYDLDNAYLCLPEHYLIKDLIYTIKTSYKEANEIIEEIENEWINIKQSIKDHRKSKQ